MLVNTTRNNDFFHNSWCGIFLFLESPSEGAQAEASLTRKKLELRANKKCKKDVFAQIYFIIKNDVQP